RRWSTPSRARRTRTSCRPISLRTSATPASRWPSRPTPWHSARRRARRTKATRTKRHQTKPKKRHRRSARRARERRLRQRSRRLGRRARSSGEGHAHHEARAAVGRRLRVHRPAVPLDDLPADVEAEAETRAVPVRLIEAIEDLRKVLRRHPDAVIAYREDERRRRARERHLHGPTFR